VQIQATALTEVESKAWLSFWNCRLWEVGSFVAGSTNGKSQGLSLKCWFDSSPCSFECVVSGRHEKSTYPPAEKLAETATSGSKLFTELPAGSGSDIFPTQPGLALQGVSPMVKLVSAKGKFAACNRV
jgi:hypothetical protein